MVHSQSKDVEGHRLTAPIGPEGRWTAENREREAGAEEYRHCRRHPLRRYLSWLAQAGNCSGLGLWLLGVIVRRYRIARSLLELATRLPGLHASARAAVQRLDRLAGASDAAGGWNELSAFFWRKLPILVYHHVGPFVPGTFHFQTVEPAAFARQLNWLRKNGFTTIHLRDWTNWLDDGASLPTRPIVLTFDDAYADIARYALPELRNRGMNGTAYVVTGRTGGTNSWDLQYVQRAHNLMGQEEIRLWSRHDIEIGCHTRTHRRLVDAKPGDLAHEIDGSARDLTTMLGTVADTFAYPYGAYDREALEEVSAGFRSAVTTRPGVNDLWTPRHQLRRANVDPRHEWFDFAFLVWLGWGPYERLHAFLARMKQAVIRKLRSVTHRRQPQIR
jgi:peptidoglycan/xylan/chitin deacetylase (PgdA/CDA1 family)